MPTDRAIFDEMASLALWGTSADDERVGRTQPGAGEQSLGEIIEAIGRALPDADRGERARLRHRLGYVAFLVGDVRTKALEAFTLMRKDAIAAKDKGLEALALCGLAFAHDFLGERRVALKHARKAAKISEKVGDRRALALALNAEAQFLKENGENSRAKKLFQRMEKIGRELEDDQLVMGAKIGLGRTTKMAEVDTAIAYYEEAIGLAKSMGDQATLALLHNNLSDQLIYQGKLRESIEVREECLRIAEKHGLQPYKGRALIGMAKAYTLLGDLDKARELLDRGFPKVLAVGDLEGDLHSSLNLAYLYVQKGDIPGAAQLYRETLERSLAAPDHACAVFAEEALELLSQGDLPKPGIMPSPAVGDETKPKKKRLLRDLDVDADALQTVQGGARYSYPTGDLAWHNY